MEMEATSQTANVLLHHLQALKAGSLDEVMLDYTPETILISPERSFHGSEEIRAFYEGALASFPPEMIAALKFVRHESAGEVGYVVWHAKPFINMSTDTFYVRDGKIAVQTFLMTF